MPMAERGLKRRTAVLIGASTALLALVVAVLIVILVAKPSLSAAGLPPVGTAARFASNNAAAWRSQPPPRSASEAAGFPEARPHGLPASHPLLTHAAALPSEKLVKSSLWGDVTPRFPLDASGGGVLKSSSDPRTYKAVVLPSGLRVMLISDPSSPAAAAAVDVPAGSMMDPDELDGLAHYVEHLVFAGSAAHPGATEWDDFLASRGGSSNAFTGDEHTAYYFDVDAAHLRGALARFADMLAAPLFAPDAMEREAEAIDAEHAKNALVDEWRVEQLIRSTSSSSHPYHRFGTGTRATLLTEPRSRGVDVRAELVHWVTKYHTADLVRLCVVGKEPLATLEAWVAESLGAALPNRDRPDPSAAWRGLPLRLLPERRARGAAAIGATPPLPPQLGVRYLVRPIATKDVLSIRWLLPGLDRHYRAKPAAYVTAILQSAAIGSLRAALRTRQWASSVEASCAERGTSWAWLTIAIELTISGVAQLDAVEALVADELKLLRAKGVAKWRWEEQRALAAAELRLAELSSSKEYAVEIASRLHRFPAAHAVVAPYLHEQWAPGVIHSILDLLRFDRALVILESTTAQKNDATTPWMHEPWYGTPYVIDRRYTEGGVDYSSGEVEEEKGGGGGAHAASSARLLALAAPNKFVPSAGIQLLPAAAMASRRPPPSRAEPMMPELIVDDIGVPSRRDFSMRPQFRVWLKTAAIFGDPRVRINVALRAVTPSNLISPRETALSELHLAAVLDSLEEELADLRRAGYGASVTSLRPSLGSGFGWQLSLIGFPAHIGTLFKLVLRRVLTVPRRERFAAVFQRQRQLYKSWRFEEPHRHATVEAAALTDESHWLPHELLAELNVFKTAAQSALEHSASVQVASSRDDGSKRAFDAVRAFVERANATMSAEMLIYGNANRASSVPLIAALRAALPSRDCGASSAAAGSSAPAACARQHARTYELHRGRSGASLALRDQPPEQVNSAAVVSFQLTPRSVQTDAMCHVFAELLWQPVYNQLRTRESLGYYTATQCVVRPDALSLTVTAQSVTRDAAMLDARIEALLQAYREVLANTGDGEGGERWRGTSGGFSSSLFETEATSASYAPYAVVEVMIVRLDSSHKSSESEMGAIWSECVGGEYKWDRYTQRLRALRLIHASDLLVFYDEYIASATRRRLGVRVDGNGRLLLRARQTDVREDEKKHDATLMLPHRIEDVAAWKRAATCVEREEERSRPRVKFKSSNAALRGGALQPL